jgi:hypothetical protein
MPNHSWDVSRSFVMIEKQWLGCFVSWFHELWPEKGMNQAELPLPSSKKPVCLQNHAESLMGCT